jgi:hypothetical protein
LSIYAIGIACIFEEGCAIWLATSAPYFSLWNLPISLNVPRFHSLSAAFSNGQALMKSMPLHEKQVLIHAGVFTCVFLSVVGV